ncbi:MAG: hypothetical protein H7Y15_09200 [Pseudonocardia sp.]|nr:hypothetical protein [Pseudonocardia sp.]
MKILITVVATGVLVVYVATLGASARIAEKPGRLDPLRSRVTGAARRRGHCLAVAGHGAVGGQAGRTHRLRVSPTVEL